jgi:hypothetical protein
VFFNMQPCACGINVWHCRFPVPEVISKKEQANDCHATPRASSSRNRAEPRAITGGAGSGYWQRCGSIRVDVRKYLRKATHRARERPLCRQRPLTEARLSVSSVLLVLLLHVGDVDDADLGIGKACIERADGVVRFELI